MKGYLGSAALAALAGITAALDPISVKGSKFFNKDGSQFFIKGVAYQADVSTQSTNSAAGGGPKQFHDPLADTNACKRDIPLLQELGTNVIRVYAIDPNADQSSCMKMLDDAGIYVIADLSQPGESINRDAPAWDDELYARYTSVVDKLAPYSNTLGFFAGNEVTNNATNTNASPFVKAAVRDMKAYIKQKGYRKIPVGYATNDDSDIRLNLAKYFNCGPADDSIDFWGYNIYSWCGKSSFTESGYDQRTKEFESYNVPVFFAEYGCNEVKPRVFTEVQAIYGDQMTPVWSGGIVYMYFQEANQFGLVSVSGSQASTLPDFDNLKAQISSISPSGVSQGSYQPTNTAPSQCPPTGSDWKASTALPPTPDKDLCGCMTKSLECVVSPNTNASAYGDLFGYICAPNALGAAGCQGISTDGNSGTYGSYSVCNAQERMSWALNAYYQDQKNKGNQNACDFDGKAITQTASQSEGNCAKKIQSAGGAQGTTVSGGSSGSGSSNKNASPMTAPSVSMAFVNIGIAVTVAFFGGIGLIVM